MSRAWTRVPSKYRVRSSVIALFVVLLSHSKAFAKTPRSLPEIRQIFSSIYKEPLHSTLLETHPDYPLQAVAQALQLEKSGDYQKEILLLEGVLLKTHYQGTAQYSSKDEAQLWAGSFGSFGLWRDSIYLLLGRAYYSSGHREISISYFSGIPPDSAFYGFARIGVVWTLLSQKNWEKASQEIDSMEKREGLGDFEKRELRLQKAYVLAESGRPEEAYTELVQVKFPESFALPLQTLRLKLAAQIQLNQYLKLSRKNTGPENKSRLQKIVQAAEAVPTQERDVEFSTLVAETYWHLASVVRSEGDPTKNRSTWVQALENGNRWISPYADHSPGALTEDALFLAVALLWEQDQFEKAVPRLLSLRRHFPQGEYREDAAQLLADRYYDLGDYDQAIRFYSELAKIGSVEKASYGVYKAAWTFYNQGDKWKALRHLERLLLAHATQKDSDSIPLLKEAEKDMLLVMAELLPWQKAFQEIDLFKYSDERKTLVREMLAHRFKEIGQYEQSAGAWMALLGDHKIEGNSFRWLEELTASLLLAGRRDLLANAIDRYIPLLPKADLPEERKALLELEKRIGAIILTIHREAKKTDDVDIWKATDALYQSYNRFYPESQKGDVWYFGAQRLEQLGKQKEAMAWYRKSASSQGFANADDSALSVLRLAKNLTSDRKTSPEIMDASSWFVEKYPKSPQRPIAELLYLEAAFYSDKMKSAREFLTSAVQNEGLTTTHYDQYLALNRRLYEALKWQDAFELGSSVLEAAKSKGNPNAEFIAKISTILQESAFQIAYQAEGKKNRKESRSWYEKVVSFSGSSEASIKAWHNWILGFELPQEADLCVETFGRHQKKYFTASRTASALPFLRAVLAKVAGAYEALGDPLNQAKSLTLGGSLDPKNLKSQQMRFEAAILHATNGNPRGFVLELEGLKASSSDILKTPESRLKIGKLLFWNREYDSAWLWIEPLLKPDEKNPQILLLVSDLVLSGQSTQFKNLERARSYLSKNRLSIGGNPLLQGVYDSVLTGESELKMIDQTLLGLSAQRGPAANTKRDLAARLAEVSSILKELSSAQDKLKALARANSSKLKIAAFCAAPKVRAVTVDKLSRLKSPAIASVQWPDFLKKLQNKIDELKAGGDEDRASCVKYRDGLAYRMNPQANENPFCSETGCFPERVEKSEELVEVKLKGKTKISRLEQLAFVLKLGGWAKAEELAYSSPTKPERALLLGVLRAALGDFSNALPLFQEAEKDPEWTASALILEASLAWKNGAKESAVRRIASVDQKTVSPFLAELCQRIRAGKNPE